VLPLVGLLVLTELLPVFLLGCLRGVAVLPLLPPRLPVGREEDEEEKDEDGVRVGIVDAGAGRREGLGFAATEPEPEPEPEGGEGAAGRGGRDGLSLAFNKGLDRAALGFALLGLRPGCALALGLDLAGGFLGLDRAALGFALLGLRPGCALALGLDLAGVFLGLDRDMTR